MQDIPYQHPVPADLDKMSLVRRLAAGLAHEIWNPLAVIKTMVFAMRADIEPGDPKGGDFDVMEKEVERIERVTQRLFDYIWPSEPILGPVSLELVIANALGQLAQKAQTQGVRIEVAVDPEVTIQADQGLLEKVFTNLALSALQTMPEGGLLSIAARPEPAFVSLAVNALPVAAVEESAAGTVAESSLGKVGVEVADTGWGIPDELIERVFEPFVIERPDGLGLALAIVQQIVEGHGGQISAQNRPEGGAIFTVTLPLAKR